MNTRRRDRAASLLVFGIGVSIIVLAIWLVPIVP